MTLMNLTAEPKLVPLTSTAKGNFKVYLGAKEKKVIELKCELTEQAKALQKVRAIFVKK